MRLLLSLLLTVVVAAGAGLALDAGVAGARPSAAAPTTVRGLVVVGCRKYSGQHLICYAVRPGHPEARMFYVGVGKRPQPGRVADVRGWTSGALIDDNARPQSKYKTWVHLRRSASSVKVVGTVHSFAGKKRSLGFFVSLWTHCGHRTYYCMGEGVFKASVPARALPGAKKAWRKSSGKSKPVWLISVKFRRGAMRLAAIRSIKDSLRRR